MLTIKNITTSTIAFALLSTFAMAGGDIAPMEPQLNMPEMLEEPVSDTNFYLGLGYSYIKMQDDTLNNEITGDAITAIIGYNLHRHLALEGRYSATLGDLSTDAGDQSWDMSNVALYLKPQYSINQIKLYGLLGYGQVTLDNGASHSEDGFQWGLGASFAATDTVEVFVDYTSLYDDDGFDDFTLNNEIYTDSITIGINYNF